MGEAERCGDEESALGYEAARRDGSLHRGAAIGRYLVLSLLGRGGMGEVFAAYDPELDRRVALKLLPAARGSEDARKRLVREARALGKLSHPNVVQVYDVGEHEGDVFVAMELVDGEPLDAWCNAAPRPGWREVLAAYLDAARGLSAAHESGLVHRDVKPSNILRGKDGRVRVVDFGLAAGREVASAPAATAPPPPASVSAVEMPALGETLPAPSGREADDDARLTAAGTVLGTPLYMAPEQHEGPTASPAADQYSLCVALYEGLYGAAPFALQSNAGLHEALADLLRRKKQGPPPAPPAGSPVPVWIHQAIVRGLAVHPADRHPSLPSLVDALCDDPAARSRARWRGAGIAVTGAALLAVAAAGWAKSGAFRNPCAHREEQLAGVWDEGVKRRVRAAFVGTGRPYAEATVTRVDALLDRYGAEWTAGQAEVCEISRADRVPREIVRLRELCMDRRRGQLQALTTLFAERPDPEVLDKAVAAAAGLYPVASCADTEALAARVRPPEDPALRARVAEGQRRVDRLEALHLAGKYREGLALGDALLAEAGAIPYPPLRAQVQYWVGRLRDRAGDDEGAKALLRDAAVSAAEGRDDVLAASAWARVLYVLGERQRRFEEASTVLSFGPTLLARAHDERTEASWLSAEGLLRLRMGRYAEAKAAQERALALFEKVLGPDHPEVATSLNNLGVALHEMGDFATARAIYERVLTLREKALGPEHPSVASTLNNVGRVLADMGDAPNAKVAHERALSLRERSLGPDHAETAMSRNNLAGVLRSLGDYAAAVAMHERVLALREKTLGPNHPDVAQSLSNLGNVRYDMGDDAGARALQERSLSLLEKVMRPDHPDLAYPLVGLGRALVRLHQGDAAFPFLERARLLRDKATGGARRDLADPLLALGELHLANGKPDEAAPLLERALTLDCAPLQSELQLTLADALWQLGKDRARARALANKARTAYERIGHRPGLARAARWLADHAGHEDGGR